MTIFKDYPYWSADTLEDIKIQVRQICNIRKDDITQINSLPNTFIGGRLVGKIPVTSTDVAVTDRIGDVSRDNSNTYVLQDISAPRWIKYSGSTF